MHRWRVAQEGGGTVGTEAIKGWREFTSEEKL